MRSAVIIPFFITVTSVLGNICQPSISIDPLENSCYNIGNKIPFRYDADCYPKSTKLDVRVCQMFPVIENRCFFYDYVRSDKYDSKLEVTSALIPGNIYCLEISSNVKNYYDQKISANGGLFTVTEKGCDYGKCHRMALPYTCPFLCSKPNVRLHITLRKQPMFWPRCKGIYLPNLSQTG
ncbi:hypothetical protein ACFFRR_007759 [Megaselia abdita]